MFLVQSAYGRRWVGLVFALLLLAMAAVTWGIARNPVRVLKGVSQSSAAVYWETGVSPTVYWETVTTN